MKKQLLLLMMLPILASCDLSSSSTSEEISPSIEDTNVQSSTVEAVDPYAQYEEKWMVYVEDIYLNVGEVIQVDNVIDLKDYNDTDVIYNRPSSRAIIIKDGKIALVYSNKYNYYNVFKKWLKKCKKDNANYNITPLNDEVAELKFDIDSRTIIMKGDLGNEKDI